MRGGVGKGIGLGLEKHKKLGSLGYLDSVVAETEFDLDATIAASYTSGDTWTDLLNTPNGDFHLGLDGTTDGTEPTFTGSAGSNSAYFLHDGTQGFQSVAVSNIACIKDGHRTDKTAFFVLTWYPKTNSVTECLFGTSISPTSRGFRLLRLVDGNIDFFQSDGSTQASAADIVTPSVDTPNILVATWNGSITTNNVKLYLNSTTPATASVTFKTDTTTSTAECGLGFTSVGNQDLTANSRVYSFAGGSKFLSDAEAANIIAHLETRHGRDYTP